MNWWPKFSITDLLWLTVAVALGFAVSQSPSPAHPESFLGYLISDLRWPEGIQATGTILLLFGLLQQAQRIMRHPSAGAAKQTATLLRLHASVCMLLAFALGAMSVAQLLFTRQFINKPRHDDFVAVYGDLWPDVLLWTALLAALHLFLFKRPDRLGTTWWRRTIDLLIVAGLLFYGFWILTDRAMISMIVHVAINGIEIAEPGWLHRKDVFPHHAIEGFRSFWLSTIAAFSVLVGVLLVSRDSCFESLRGRRHARILFWMIVSSLAVFAWWFSNVEFPRIDPDLASTSSPRLWSDTVAGVLLGAGLAIYLALQTASHCNDLHKEPIEVPVASILVSVGALLVIVAHVWFLVERLRIIHSIADGFFGGQLVSFGEMLGSLVAWPETLLPLLVLFSALALLWQSVRRPDATKVIAPICPRRFAYQLVAWAALLAVGVPALWAFSMCYWLGPWVM